MILTSSAQLPPLVRQLDELVRRVRAELDSFKSEYEFHKTVVAGIAAPLIVGPEEGMPFAQWLVRVYKGGFDVRLLSAPNNVDPIVLALAKQLNEHHRHVRDRLHVQVLPSYHLHRDTVNVLREYDDKSRHTITALHSFEEWLVAVYEGKLGT
jgi:hypothetical protein